MLGLAGRLDPDSMAELAGAVYAGMALTGITTVAEFHYVHHDVDGVPYGDPNAMGHALIHAAHQAGIRLVLLDACYLRNGFDQPLEGVARRFGDRDAEGWAERVDLLRGFYGDSAMVRVGVAAHSVRAVAPDDLAVVAGYAATHGLPLHIHLSEQPAENEAAMAATGLSPTGLLDAAGGLAPGTAVVHATHADPADVARPRLRRRERRGLPRHRGGPRRRAGPVRRAGDRRGDPGRGLRPAGHSRPVRRGTWDRVPRPAPPRTPRHPLPGGPDGGGHGRRRPGGGHGAPRDRGGRPLRPGGRRSRRLRRWPAGHPTTASPGSCSEVRRRRSPTSWWRVVASSRRVPTTTSTTWWRGSTGRCGRYWRERAGRYDRPHRPGRRHHDGGRRAIRAHRRRRPDRRRRDHLLGG